jgi:hypothetical protein
MINKQICDGIKSGAIENIYVDGQKIEKVYCDGDKIYPKRKEKIMTELQTRKFLIGCEKCGWEAYYFDTEYEVSDDCPGCDEGELLPVTKKVEDFPLKAPGYALKVEIDCDPTSPLEDDNMGTMACSHDGYNLGDDQYSDPDEVLQNMADDVEAEWNLDMTDDEIMEAIEKVAYVLPLYLYDHSGITMSTTPFNCSWDSGQVGYIYTSKANAEDNAVTDENVAYDNMRAEVATYDQYLTGSVYQWTIEDEDGEVVDSVRGYYSKEQAEQEGKEALEALKTKEK